MHHLPLIHLFLFFVIIVALVRVCSPSDAGKSDAQR